jgi:hypothetical protein
MNDAKMSEGAPMDLMKIAQSVLRSPGLAPAVQRGMELRDAALSLQTAVLGALNLPTASDLATVAGRLRQLSQRLESLEDTVDRVDRNVTRIQASELNDSVH